MYSGLHDPVEKRIFPPFWIIILLTLPKQISQKRACCYYYLVSFFFSPLWDQNLALCRELDMLKHEVGTEQCSEKSQLWAQEPQVCPEVPWKCLAQQTYSRLVLVQHVSMDLHSSLYYYGGRCKAIKPWRTWPCDRCLEIAQHPLTTAQLSLWCPGWVLELPVRPLWRTSPHSLPHLQRPSGDEEEGTRQRYNRAVISTVPCLKTLCGTDDKRSFAKLIAGKFQPLSIFKRPFIICLFKAIWEKSSKFCSWREAARTAIKSQAVQWHMDCEGLGGYDDLSYL